MITKKMKDALLDCSQITEDIMDKISEELNSKGVTFTHDNKSEIIINDNTKKDIIEIIEKSGSISKERMKLLLQVSESNGNVYVRQKFN